MKNNDFDREAMIVIFSFLAGAIVCAAAAVML